MDFFKSSTTTKTGIFGVLAILAGVAGLIPMVGTGLNMELVSLGIAMLTLRHAIYKQDIQKLDPVLDKILGDKLSEVSQDILEKFLAEKEEGEK